MNCQRGKELAVDAAKRHLATLFQHAEGIRQEDPDAIHDMRVASRRLRAVEVDFRNSCPSETAHRLRKATRKITRLLGNVRELDVSVMTLTQLLEEAGEEPDDAGLLRYLKHQRAATASDLDELLRFLETGTLQESVAGFVDSVTPLSTCVLILARRHLWDTEQRATDAWARYLASAEDSHLHRVRVALKKHRYRCELFAPLCTNQLADHIQTLKAVQDALGAWNDLRILLGYQRSFNLAVNKKTRREGAALSDFLCLLAQNSRKSAIKEAMQFFHASAEAARSDAVAWTADVCCAPQESTSPRENS